MTKASHVVRIDPTLCIGCAKCLVVCPVDAIVGSHKTLHSVLEDDCIGCDLCLPPCPVDCIISVPITENKEERREKASRAKILVQQRAARLSENATRKEEADSKVLNQDKKAAIAAILARTKARQPILWGEERES